MMKEKKSIAHHPLSEEGWQKVFRAIDEDWSHSRMLTNEEMAKADKWCIENCQGLYIKSNSRIYVKEERDAVLFLLRWS